MGVITMRFFARVILFLLPSSLLSLPMMAADTSSPPVYIITHSSVPQIKYSRSMLRNIFTMQKRYWSNEKKIKVFVLPDTHPIHKQFTKYYFGLFPHQFRRIWDKRTFSGMGSSPVKIANVDKMLEKVSSTSNAIGYIPDIPKNPPSTIRIINYD